MAEARSFFIDIVSQFFVTLRKSTLMRSISVDPLSARSNCNRSYAADDARTVPFAAVVHLVFLRPLNFIAAGHSLHRHQAA
jgi:hypothetical protein